LDNFRATLFRFALAAMIAGGVAILGMNGASPAVLILDLLLAVVGVVVIASRSRGARIVS
jgi:hypothetical protein